MGRSRRIRLSYQTTHVIDEATMTRQLLRQTLCSTLLLALVGSGPGQATPPSAESVPPPVPDAFEMQRSSRGTPPPPPPPIDFPGYLTDTVLTATYLGLFGIEAPDLDPYDFSPYETFNLCIQNLSAFEIDPNCDHVSVSDAYGDTHAIVPYPEAVDPVRGQEVRVWIAAQNIETNQLDQSYARRMRAALSNIALKPPGFETQAPFLQVVPSQISEPLDSIDGWTFRWPQTTTGLGGIWGGVNTGATKHILTMHLTQSSATCKETVTGCPGAENVCTSTDTGDCPGTSGFCTVEQACSRNSEPKSFEIPLTGLTNSFQNVGEGQARVRSDLGDGFTYVVFKPNLEAYEHLFDGLAPDRVMWRVATCNNIATTSPDGVVEVCGRPDSGFAHYAIGRIGFVGDGGGGGGGGGLNPGVPFGDSPLVDTFRHEACIGCHVIQREALAGEGRGAIHLNLGLINGIEDFTNPTVCEQCHGHELAPQVLGTTYSANHGLDAAYPGEDYETWWDWFSPVYEGSLEWPEFLEDPAGQNYDPASACALFRAATPTPEQMKHHLFEDPRVVWSIVGGDKPNTNYVAELAPPGSALDQSSTQSEQVAVLETWEQWVDEWVDGGMNCGSTLTGSSAGGGNEDVNTTPPTTTSDGSSGTWVGGAPASGDTTLAHLDCTPDQDSADPNCSWTFFSCGSDDVQVESQLVLCDEMNATPYTQVGVSPAGLCDTTASGCYGFEPGVGGGVYWGHVEIPAEVGDHTRLAFLSIDAEGNREVVRAETYDFVETDLTAPVSGAELFYDIDADEHKLRFSCRDNSETCMIFYEANGPGDENRPAFNDSTDILNSNGNPFDADGNVLGYLGNSEIKRIRWAAIDGAAGQKNAEFDQQCFEDALDLCPGKLALQNACVATCEDGIRSDCEVSCASRGVTDPLDDCVETCVADSPVDCMVGCEETCDTTFTGCPGQPSSPGQETGCVTRNGPVQCYHEFVYDPAVFYDTDAPGLAALPSLASRDDGTYATGFNVTLVCSDPVNTCEIFFTEDGSEPTADPRLLYREALPVPSPIEGRTSTVTFKFFARDNAVPPNATPVETRTYTVVLPHTDDDMDGFTEDDGDCNDEKDTIFPGAPEICDFYDNDCNGIVDDVVGPACALPEIFSDGFESGNTSAW